MNNLDKPKRPLIRIITEGTSGTCPICRSTEIKRFIFFGRSIGCIQPKCENYYKRCEKIFPDEFDKNLKILHESTHDKKIREAIITIQEYKIKYLYEQLR